MATTKEKEIKPTLKKVEKTDQAPETVKNYIITFKKGGAYHTEEIEANSETEALTELASRYVGYTVISIGTDEPNPTETIEDIQAKLDEARHEIEILQNKSLENDDLVKEFIEWSETDEGRESLQYKEWKFPIGESDGIDLTGLNKSVLLKSTLEFAICYIMPGKGNPSHEKVLKKYLALEKTKTEVK